jgi:hypothetical protein
LYPLDDNNVQGLTEGSRSPKTLASLATDALCRSLAYLEGELPPGLPQEVVDTIVQSLQKHSALNATTLKVLCNCELVSLSLAGCRGVTDQWLAPLGTSATPGSSPRFSPKVGPLDSQNVELDLMDLEGSKNDFFYGTLQEQASSLSSIESFVSATSTPYALEEATTTAPFATFQQTSVTANLTLLDLRGSQHLTDKGLLQLTDLTRLEYARFDNCHALTGRGLLALGNSNQLHTLSLTNCRRLTDEAIINISHLNLHSLSLGGCRCLTDRSLSAIADMLEMERLDFSQCDLITDEGLEQLKNLRALQELSLGWCRQIGDAGIDSLTLQPGREANLRILKLCRCGVTSAGIAYIARLLALEVLDLNGCSRVSSAALGKAVGQLKTLTTLDVSYCPGILYVWYNRLALLWEHDC